MLELARRGGTEAESNTAKKMAEELLAKYSLLIADIETKTEPDDYMFEGAMTSTPRATWQDSIYVAISKLYSCTYFKRYRRDGTPMRTIVGELSNVETAKKVAAHIVLIALTLSKESCKSAKQLRSFKKGFAVRVWSRVDDKMIEDNRGSLVDSIPEMKRAAEAAQSENNSTTTDDAATTKAKEENIDKRYFQKGSTAANLVSLTLHEFLR